MFGPFVKPMKGAQLSGGSACLTLIFLTVVNFFLGGLFVNYTLGTVFGKDAGYLVGGIVGLVLGQIAFVTAIISLLIRALGVHLPLVHIG